MNGSFTFGAIIIAAAIVADGYLDRRAEAEQEQEYLRSCYQSDPDNARKPPDAIRHACRMEYRHGPQAAGSPQLELSSR